MTAQRRVYHDDDTIDERFTVDLEWCGYAVQRYVARFCDAWIGQYETEDDAWQAGRTYNMLRLLPADVAVEAYPSDTAEVCLCGAKATHVLVGTDYPYPCRDCLRKL